MRKTFLFTCICLTSLIIFLTSCNHSSTKKLKIAATSVPHAEILEFIKPKLEKEGIDLDIIIVDDYNIPNRALADKEVDANFFQHLPFLEAQMKDFNYQLEPLANVHLEPMGIYSRVLSSLNDLKIGAKIAIPSDPSNEARALLLLEQEGLLTLKNKKGNLSILDVDQNPLKIQLIEMDAPLLSRALEDVDAAALNANFALLAGLFPQKDALALENKDSQYVNIVAIRKGEAEREDLQTLKKTLNSEAVRDFIEKHYKGAVSPAF